MPGAPGTRDFTLFKSPYLNVYRRYFDYWLNLKASAQGAAIWSRAELLSWEEIPEGIQVHVKCRDHEKQEISYRDIKADYLIAADGGNSRVRKLLFPEEVRKFFIAYQEYWTGEAALDPEYFHAFIFSHLDSFYNWFNQKEALLIIGTAGALSKKGLADNHHQFVDYLKENHGLKLINRERREACYQSNLSAWGGEGSYTVGQGRILLVGEAAGFMDIFGEGIPAALKSGRAAAQSLLESEAGNALGRYQERVSSLIRRLSKNWDSFREI